MQFVHGDFMCISAGCPARDEALALEINFYCECGAFTVN